MRKILFHHIPKTAGTSLIAHASHYFGSAACPARYDFQLTDEMIRDEALVFYHGHFTQSLVTRFRTLWPETFVFSFVRHPFSRVLSQYYNWIDRDRVREELALVAAQSGPTEHLSQLRQKFEETIFVMSLESFLASEDPDIRQVVNNIQSQYMTDFELPDCVRFSKACHNATARYDFIGVQELYVPCLRIVEAKCRLPEGALGGNERANDNDDVKLGGKYRVSARELALLERRSSYDLALFHSCHAALLKDYAAYLPADIGAFDAFADLPILVG